MTNGNGGPPPPASGLPRSGNGGPQGGSLAVGQGPGGPGPGQGGPAAVSANGLAGQASPPASPTPARATGAPVPAGVQVPPRKGSAFSISNWRVRWRLVAIITVPTVTALILGVIQIVSAVDNYSSFKRVQNLASLNSLVVNAAGLLADERDDSAGFVAAGGQNNAAGTATLKATVTKDQASTTKITGDIVSQAQAVINGSGYRSQTVLDLSNGVLADIADLQYIRDTV